MKLLIFSSIICIFLYGCSGDFTKKKNPDNQMIGWINDDTYRVYASGIPNIEVKGKSTRRYISRKKAVINAKTKTVEILKKAKLNKEEINSGIENGAVVFEEYDCFDNCEIIYEIKHKNLRKKIR